LSAVRGICFYLYYCMRSNQSIITAKNDALQAALVKCVSAHNSSPELKELAVQTCIYLTCIGQPGEQTQASSQIALVENDNALMKTFATMLVSGARERSPSTRLSSEVGLVKLFKLTSSSSKTSPLYEVICQLKHHFEILIV
jgi:hypothetical protein